MSFDPETIPPASVEDILYLVQEMARRHEESDGDNIGFETATIIMIARYPGQIEKVHAIMERMRLLPQMMEDPRMKGWSMDQGGRLRSYLGGSVQSHRQVPGPLRSSSRSDLFRC